jgi:aminodeoxychorismate synthase component I
MTYPRQVQFAAANPATASRWNFHSDRADAHVICPAGGMSARLFDGAEPIRKFVDPLDALDWMRKDVRDPRRAATRWVGFLGFDLSRHFESLSGAAVDDLKLPLFLFSRHHRTSGQPGTATNPIRASAQLRSSFTRQQYERAVLRTIEYIAAGDVFQVNLAQRFTVPLVDHPRKIYDRLRERTPASYGAFLDFGEFQIISNSPELFFHVTPDRRIITRPIKGTRPRKPGMDIELRDSRKDQAELAMIVDLERNDLGRICEVGSVKVTEPRVIEEHPTVYHGVATIEGILREEVTLIDILRAMFPSGSVTGAPKIRAMQIIDELEPVRRGPYCGAIGYIDPDGTMEFNVAIRTMIVKDGEVQIPVGGGIVADSDPEAEYEETLVKAQAMFAAVGVSLE